MVGCLARLRSPMASAIGRSKDGAAISNCSARVDISKGNAVKGHRSSAGLRVPVGTSIGGS